MKKREIKVKITYTAGYKESVTAACVKVARKRVSS